MNSGSGALYIAISSIHRSKRPWPHGICHREWVLFDALSVRQLELLAENFLVKSYLGTNNR